MLCGSEKNNTFARYRVLLEVHVAQEATPFCKAVSNNIWKDSNNIWKDSNNIQTMIGTTEIIVIALVILLLFGGTQIPKLMRGIGKGVKAYKDGLAGAADDEEPAGKADKEQTDKTDKEAGDAKH